MSREEYVGATFTTGNMVALAISLSTRLLNWALRAQGKSLKCVNCNSGGAKAIGINRSKPCATLAKSFGPSRADSVFVPEKPPPPVADPVDASRDMTDHIIRKLDLRDGADIVLECTGAESFI
ncbi:hypothetical protein F5B19DRAFT_489201 [Rostrohypoxylon terebratum]|nr:hypothetical protein F5B19DRAFT_489201 [Rostrohypoxylon terebratum]